MSTGGTTLFGSEPMKNEWGRDLDLIDISRRPMRERLNVPKTALKSIILEQDDNKRLALIHELSTAADTPE